MAPNKVTCSFCDGEVANFVGWGLDYTHRDQSKCIRFLNQRLVALEKSFGVSLTPEPPTLGRDDGDTFTAEDMSAVLRVLERLLIAHESGPASVQIRAADAARGVLSQAKSKGLLP